MKIYWGLGSIPELADLPKAERKAAWRACYLRALRHWQTWAVYLVFALCLAVCATTVNYILVWATRDTPTLIFETKGLIAFGIVGVIEGIITGLILWQIITRQARPHLREYLKDR